jgi:hypothetical protein
MVHSATYIHKYHDLKMKHMQYPHDTTHNSVVKTENEVQIMKLLIMLFPFLAVSSTYVLP